MTNRCGCANVLISNAKRRNSRIQDADRELSDGARQLRSVFELAFEQRAEVKE